MKFSAFTPSCRKIFIISAFRNQCNCIFHKLLMSCCHMIMKHLAITTHFFLILCTGRFIIFINFLSLFIIPCRKITDMRDSPDYPFPSSSTFTILALSKECLFASAIASSASFPR